MPDLKRLKLLVVTMLYEPDCVGIAAIASDMCAALAERGHDVTVYTTYPYYPEWKLKSDVNCWRIQHERTRHVNVHRYGIFIPSNPSRLVPRVIHELSFPASLLRSLFHRQDFDVVMVYCPLMGSVVFAALRKLFYRGPLWVNIQDIPVQAAAASGIIRSSLFGRVAARVQKLVFNCGDVWSSISPDMVGQLESMKTPDTPDTPVHLCPNWLTDSLHKQVQQLCSKVGRVPRGRPHLLYCGTIGKKQGLLEFCQQLSLCEADFQFQIRGDGGEAATVERWVQARRDSRFNFASLLPEAEFVRAIHAADWFVIPQKSSAGNSFFPSKLIPSMSVATPVVAVSEQAGPLGVEVAQHGIGLLVDWSQLDELPSRLDSFQRDPAGYQLLQENCLRRATTYGRDRAIDRLETLLHNLRDDYLTKKRAGIAARRAAL